MWEVMDSVNYFVVRTSRRNYYDAYGIDGVFFNTRRHRYFTSKINSLSNTFIYNHQYDRGCDGNQPCFEITSLIYYDSYNKDKRSSLNVHLYTQKGGH